MSKVFVIPDVHLKPWMFEKAEREFYEETGIQSDQKQAFNDAMIILTFIVHSDEYPE